MKRFLVMNWKMHPATLAEAKVLFAATSRAAKDSKVSVVVAPPTLFCAELAKKKTLAVAVQHASPDAVGAQTGDVSLAQAKDVGATHAIIGHAERRALGLSEEAIRASVQSALTLGMTPIVCIGERERDQHGDYFDVVKAQLFSALSGVSEKQIKNIIIAYEPVWTIGAEKPMSTHQMHEMAIYIRKALSVAWGKAGLSVPVLYGGAMEAAYARAMLDEAEVQGFLVGRASVDRERMRALFSSLV